MIKHAALTLGLSTLLAGLSHSAINFYQDTNANSSYDSGEEITAGSLSVLGVTANSNIAGSFHVKFDLTSADDFSTFATTLGFERWDQALSVSLNNSTLLSIWETGRHEDGSDDSDIEFVDSSASGSGITFRAPWLINTNGLDRLQATVNTSGVTYQASNNSGGNGIDSYYTAFHDGSINGSQTVVDPATLLQVGQNTLTIHIHNNGGGNVNADFNFSGDISAVPEPSSALLACLGLGFFLVRRQRKS